jgi:biopolymer transport protein TolR
MDQEGAEVALSRGGSGGRGGGEGGGFRDINVTPLVDVMLVLLIVFMVTAPLLTTGLHVDLPEVNAANTPLKDAKLVVTVTKDEKIMFGERDVTASIETELRSNKRVQEEHELYILADKEARYGVVARTVAAARSAGVTSLNLLVEPEEDSKK